MAKNEKIGAKSDDKKQENQNFITRTIDFYNKHQQVIYGVLIALLVVAFGIIAASKFYFQPRNQKAAALILAPIQYYNQAIQAGDTTAFNLALEGDEENEGFLTLISSYKMTKVANTSNYLAGLCYLNMGQKEEALEHLLKFKKKEDVHWFACQMLIGDLYDEQGDDAKAIKYYKNVAKGNEPFNTPIALFKLGQMYEKSENWKEAYNAYNKIEKDFYKEYQSMGVVRFVEKAKIKSGN